VRSCGSMIQTTILQYCPNVDAAPTAPGAYILQIDLAEAVLVSTARQPSIGLLPGRYWFVLLVLVSLRLTVFLYAAAEMYADLDNCESTGGYGWRLCSVGFRCRTNQQLLSREGRSAA
jgi:hypothetical protein